MSAINNNERIIEKKDMLGFLKKISRKKLILYLTSGITGVKIAEFVAVNSPKVDSFFFEFLPEYLYRCDYKLLGELEIPNWFSATMILSLIVGTLADTKIKRNELFEKERRR